MTKKPADIAGQIYEKVGENMVAMIEKSTDCMRDIAYYAKNGRLSGPSDGKRYDWRKMIELSKELERSLTDEEAEKFSIK